MRALAAVLAVIFGSAVACRSSVQQFPGMPGGEPYPTVAWFDPAWPSVLVGGHDCGARIQVEQTVSAVRIATFSLPVRPGFAVACAHFKAQIVALRAPLGNRPLLGQHGSPLTALAWRSRLHPGGSWRAGMDIFEVPAGIWTLTFDAQLPGPTGLVTLTSRPASPTVTRTSAESVRGLPMLATCPTSICWDEGGIAYQLAYAVGYGDRAVLPATARRRAIAIAASLGYA